MTLVLADPVASNKGQRSQTSFALPYRTTNWVREEESAPVKETISFSRAAVLDPLDNVPRSGVIWISPPVS